MGKREDKRGLKNCVLHKIRENKAILFGAFTNNITKEKKQTKWREIAVYAQSLGVIPTNKDAAYLRDVWWPNVRKTSLNKIDNARQTGSAGGTDKILTHIDDSVLSIIGKDSPIIEGLGVSDSIEEDTPSVSGGTQAPITVSEVEGTPVAETDGNAARDAGISLRNISWRKKQSSTVDMQKQATPSTSWLEEKQEWQIKLMKINYYKAQLECRQLELTLGIPVSDFTADLPDGPHNSDIVIMENIGLQ